MNKFKVGDKVRVIRREPSWMFWMSEMGNLVGQTCTIVGEWKSPIGTYPTLIVPGYCCGIGGQGREVGEYGFPEHCLELAIKPGEQLLFSFMEKY